jgi:cytochrome P450
VSSNNVIALLKEAQLQEALAKKGSQKQVYLTDESIVAQSVIFFAAGFDNISATVAVCCFLLAKNPRIQDQLYKEILRVEKEMSADGVSQLRSYNILYVILLIFTHSTPIIGPLLGTRTSEAC